MLSPLIKRLEPAIQSLWFQLDRWQARWRQRMQPPRIGDVVGSDVSTTSPETAPLLGHVVASTTEQCAANRDLGVVLVRERRDRGTR